MMKLAFAALFAILANGAYAENAQQNKMAACNAEAKDLKGDERKKFMSDCLKTKKASQQDKMKTCNATAKEKALKGDERKQFMKECLKGDSNPES